MIGWSASKRTARAAAAAGLVMALVATGGCRGNGSDSVGGVSGPIAAVMDAKGAVVLVDLKRGAVLRTVKMRSWTADICADGSGYFVTAQSGGVGDEADNAVGIIPVRTGGKVVYVPLPRPNPLGVECVGPGQVLVDHGWMDAEGMFACVVDTLGRRVVRRGHVPDNNEEIVFAAGQAWSVGVNLLTDRPSLRRVDRATLESSEVTAPTGFRPRCGSGDAVVGWLPVPAPARNPGDTCPAVLARVDPATGSMLATASVTLADGPGRLVACGDHVAAVDFAGESLDGSGGPVRVFDGETLEPVRTISAPGFVCDAAAWGGRLVLVGFRDRKLRVVDPVTGEVEAVVALPRLAPLPLRVAVLE